MFAPMPKASERSATEVTTGLRNIVRAPKRPSCNKLSSQFHPQVALVQTVAATRACEEEVVFLGGKHGIPDRRRSLIFET